MTVTNTGQRMMVWDLPVRLVHWSFVALLPAMWWSGEQGELELHTLLGEIFLGLVLFRIVWGFAGSQTARFAQFVKGPVGVLAYLRKAAPPARPGHNPIGGWSVVAMLATLGFQIGLGLIAQDVDGLVSGPLSHLVSFETSDAAREWHQLIFNVILALVVMHISAILFYRIVKHNDLIGPMLTGSMKVDGEAKQPMQGSPLLAAACALASTGLAYWVALGAPPI